MKTYEIENFHTPGAFTLMGASPVIEAETGRKALSQYLKEIGFKGNVKVSASNIVHFKVTPIVIEDGKKYIDRRNGQRALWYQIVNA